MLLSIRHRTLYRYEPAATGAALRLKLFPRQTASQTPRSWSVVVNGGPPQSKIVNGYGDEEAIWITHSGVAEVEITASGLIETGDAQGVLGDLSGAARPAMFQRLTDLTKPDDAIRALARDAAGGLAGLDAAHALSGAVRDAMEYSPCATGAATTAAEALHAGAGVCQDHSHVMIAAARSLGAAARYVVGYLYVGDAEEDLVTGGDEAGTETHAWIEIWVEGLGWVGFDPANRLCPTDRYVRVAAGLDASDAAPLRGVAFGGAEETLEAEVKVALETRMSQSQQQ